VFCGIKLSGIFEYLSTELNIKIKIFNRTCIYKLVNTRETGTASAIYILFDNKNKIFKVGIHRKQIII